MNPETDATSEADASVEVEPVGVDEIVRQERVRGIFDSRRKCRKARSEAKAMKNKGLYDHPQHYREHLNKGTAVYRDHLEAYVREVESLCSQTDEGRRLWNRRDFGSFGVQPDVEEVPGDTDNIRLKDGTPLAEKVEGQQVPVRGLNSLFELSPPFEVEFEITVPSAGLGRGETRKTLKTNREIPIPILDKMFGAVNGYLAEIGFGVEVGKAEKNTKLDDDLINEVEQWRREHL